MSIDNPQNQEKTIVTATDETQTPSKPAKSETTQPSTDEKVYTRKEYAGIQTQLNLRNTELAELRTQFDAITMGKTQAEQLAEQRFAALSAATTQAAQLQEQLAPLADLSLKVTAFRNLLSGEDALELPPAAALKLFDLLDEIPAGTDVETTKAKIKKLADFGQSLATTREVEVTEGATPGFAGGQAGTDDPTTREGWVSAVSGKSQDDPIWGRYFNWLKTSTG